MKFTSQLSCALIPLLVVSPLWAEAPAPAGSTPAADGAPALLQLRVIESDGPNVVMNSHSAKGISIQVTDGNGTAVSDAAVAFRFPESGASAAFRDGSHSAVAYTDAAGTAHVSDFQWNNQPGPLALRITASKANTHAGLLLEQTLTASVEPAIAAPVSPVSAAPVQAAAISVPAPDFGPVLPPPSAPATAEPAETVAVAMNRPATSAVSVAAEIPANAYRASRLGIAPAISISSTDRNMQYHGSFFDGKKKWIILGVLAGVGVGAGLLLMNHSSSASSASGVSVGTPTITIGHP